MANWQEKIGDTLRGITDKQEALVGGVQQSITLAGSNLERFASFQIGLATDTADAAVAQIKLLGQPGTPVSYLKREAELVADGVRSIKGKASEFSDLVSDCASDTVGLFGIGAKTKASSRTRKAA